MTMDAEAISERVTEAMRAANPDVQYARRIYRPGDTPGQRAFLDLLEVMSAALVGCLTEGADPDLVEAVRDAHEKYFEVECRKLDAAAGITRPAKRAPCVDKGAN